MHTTTAPPRFHLPTGIAAGRTGVARLVAWMRRLWEDIGLDPDERYLRNAIDLADLERRQRCLQRGRGDALVFLHLGD